MDSATGTVTPPLQPGIQQWVQQNLPRVVRERDAMQPYRRLVRMPLKSGDRWIVYMRRADDPQHVAGFVVRNAGLTELAERALGRRSPFPSTLGNRLTQDDLFLRLARPGAEIFRTAGTFVPRHGRRIVLPESMGDILGGATIECSFSERAIPILVAGGIPSENDAAPIVMLVATVCVLGAVVLVLRRARELDRLRSDFVAGVSHELRTPLTQIRIFAETLLLSRVRSEADRQRSLQNIARETTRLSHLVENLLSFSRGERGILKIVRTKHDVSAIVRDAVASFTALAKPSQATFRVDAAEPCVAAVDEDALKQVVLNLLDNALRYGRRGQVIDVSVEPLDASIRIAVEDEGPGIPPEERERIWMKFYRLERDRETNHTGSGIGLAVVRELVERHDGRCTVVDGSRGGARFVIEIPWESAR
jgi:signal transduction histidine kinase